MTAFTSVGAGNVGIVVKKSRSQRGVQDFTLTTGWVGYWPLTTEIISYPISVQNVVWTKSPHEGNPVDESITFTNKDKMVVNMDVNLAYRLTPDRVPAFYVKFRVDELKTFTDGFMRNIALECINEAGGRFSIDEIMGDNALFLGESRKCLQKSLDEYGIVIEQFGVIGAPRPPQSVIDAINATTQAKQIALQKQNEVTQIQAEAAKAVAKAEGEAKAKVTLATAEAEANRIRTSSLTPSLLELKRLENQHDAIWRWNGQQPQVISGSGNGLLLQLSPKE